MSNRQRFVPKSEELATNRSRYHFWPRTSSLLTFFDYFGDFLQSGSHLKQFFYSYGQRLVGDGANLSNKRCWEENAGKTCRLTALVDADTASVQETTN